MVCDYRSDGCLTDCYNSEEVVRMRVCWECEHIIFNTAERDWSDVTPGDDFRLSCGKSYWEFEQYKDDLPDFRRKLESAETCKDFKER